MVCVNSFLHSFLFVAVLLSFDLYDRIVPIGGDYMEQRQLGVLLRQLRIESKLTQAELAKAAGISTGTIQQYEYGTRIPKTGTLKKICKALKCETSKKIALFEALSHEKALSVVDSEELRRLQLGVGKDGLNYLSFFLNKSVDEISAISTSQLSEFIQMALDDVDSGNTKKYTLWEMAHLWSNVSDMTENEAFEFLSCYDIASADDKDVIKLILKKYKKENVPGDTDTEDAGQ